MSYIEKEPLVEFITNGLNNPDKTKAFGYDAIEILTEIEYAPTADVVPKSESDMLHHLLKDAWKRVEELNNLCGELQKAKTEVTREIFEEIERKVKASIVVHLEEINKEHIQDTPLYDRHSGIIFALRGMEYFIAELKKKYQEGE